MCIYTVYTICELSYEGLIFQVCHFNIDNYYVLTTQVIKLCNNLAEEGRTIRSKSIMDYLREQKLGINSEFVKNNSVPPLDCDDNGLMNIKNLTEYYEFHELYKKLVEMIISTISAFPGHAVESMAGRYSLMKRRESREDASYDITETGQAVSHAPIKKRKYEESTVYSCSSSSSSSSCAPIEKKGRYNDDEHTVARILVILKKRHRRKTFTTEYAGKPFINWNVMESICTQ